MNVWVKSAAVLLVAAAIGWNQENTVNVNSRYTVESVEVSGEKEGRLTQGLRDDLRQQVGQKFNPEIFQDLAKRIRREPWGRDMLLVAVTGWGQDGDRQRTSDAGFDHHLVKPAQPALIQQILAQTKERK